MSQMYGKANESTNIGDLPNEIMHKILESMPIQDAAFTSVLSKHWRQMWITLPSLVFDYGFFRYIEVIYGRGQAFPFVQLYAACIMHKILMQHSGPILGFHIFLTDDDNFLHADVDSCILFVSKHGVQKLTIDLDPNNRPEYELPYGIMTCPTLTHLNLSFCRFKLSDISIKFPNLVCLEILHSFVRCGSEEILSLPFLRTFKLTSSGLGDAHVRMDSPNLENFSILDCSRPTVSFFCFNLNQIFKSIKHLSLYRYSLEVIKCSSERLVQPLKLLSIYDFDFCVEHISCVLFLLRSSPNLYELDMDEVVEVDESGKLELFSYLSNEESKVDEALMMIRTVRLKKFKGTRSEMCLVKLFLAHSPKLERMIVQPSETCNANEHLKELFSYPRRSTKAVLKYL